jgi:hypothetical protein
MMVSIKPATLATLLVIKPRSATMSSVVVDPKLDAVSAATPYLKPGGRVESLATASNIKLSSPFCNLAAIKARSTESKLEY